MEPLLERDLPGQLIFLEIVRIIDTLEGRDPDLRRGEYSDLMKCGRCKQEVRLEDAIRQLRSRYVSWCRREVRFRL